MSTFRWSNQLPIHNPSWVNLQCKRLAAKFGLKCDVWFKEEGYRFLVIRSRASESRGLPRVYLSAGIHGDEAGSVLGLMMWLNQCRRWLGKFHFTIFPCLNPWGLKMNNRLDSKHRDLNRCYGRMDVASVAAHKKVFGAGEKYDLALMLHEDYDAEGMYLYEVSNEPEFWGADLLKAASGAVAIDKRINIEGRVAKGGVVRRNLKSKAWQARFQEWGYPEAVHLYMHYCPRVYTLETPSEFDLRRRAEAHLLAINCALQKLRQLSTGKRCRLDKLCMSDCSPLYQ